MFSTRLGKKEAAILILTSLETERPRSLMDRSILQLSDGMRWLQSLGKMKTSGLPIRMIKPWGWDDLKKAILEKISLR